MQTRQIILLLTLLWVSLSTKAMANDNNVTVYRLTEGNIIYLMAKLNNASDMTITVTATMNNMEPSSPLPMTIDTNGASSGVLVAFRPIDPNMPSGVTGKYYWKYGGRQGSETANYNYSLPYRSAAYPVIQGPHGSFSHQIGTQDSEAIDWAMPIGTRIYPARPGTVVAYRADCNDSAAYSSRNSEPNYLIIKHDDGTYAEYMHLKKDGILVRLGDRVNLNQPIALSGNSGYSTSPHLHFVVFYTLDGYSRRPIPVSFVTRGGTAFTPESGRSY